MATPVFSNAPRFTTKPLSLEETLNLDHFDVLTNADPATSSVNACNDPNLGTTFIKNIVHQVIRVGGRPIDINFFMDLFQSEEKMVTTKRLFNHYITDPDMNIYAAATVSGTAPGEPATFQVLKQNHGGDNGSFSLPATGYILMDKDNMVQYTITDVDTTVDWAHKVEVTPTDSDVTVNIQANKPYLVLPARMVGGYSCQQTTNSMMSIGYTQEVNFLRLRHDWEVTIDLLRAYRDKIQYAVIYDYEGQPKDAWDVYEAQQARLGLRMAFNVLSMIGSPTTNADLISGVGATIDGDHTGYYGLIPSIKYGGGVVNPFPASTGFDLESDGEPMFLYQDSLKRTKKFLVMHGTQFGFGLDYRSNKMVAREQVGANMFEAYKRMGNWLSPKDVANGGGYLSELAKIGISSYNYRGFQLDFKHWDAMSDSRFMGSDLYSNMAVWFPMEGITENGKNLNPIEFYQYGNNGWTGDYFETMVDQRKTNGMCEKLSGYSAQSMAMKVHGTQLFMLSMPVADA